MMKAGVKVLGGAAGKKLSTRCGSTLSAWTRLSGDILCTREPAIKAEPTPGAGEAMTCSVMLLQLGKFKQTRNAFYIAGTCSQFRGNASKSTMYIAAEDDYLCRGNTLKSTMTFCADDSLGSP
jgi:hypothetical protein